VKWKKLPKEWAKCGELEKIPSWWTEIAFDKKMWDVERATRVDVMKERMECAQAAEKEMDDGASEDMASLSSGDESSDDEKKLGPDCEPFDTTNFLEQTFYGELEERTGDRRYMGAWWPKDREGSPVYTTDSDDPTVDCHRFGCRRYLEDHGEPGTPWTEYVDLCGGDPDYSFSAWKRTCNGCKWEMISDQERANDGYG
jgi:hypothetical protein